MFEKLFPNQIPKRNSIKISISEYNRDMIDDAICFITRIRLNAGQYKKKEMSLLLVKHLQVKKEQQFLSLKERIMVKK